ncbi:hypothetical protein BCR36DRAFT_359645 [Piromyces finnis]|uniref:Uncharacterized protein n=1 Tax=Piromyces finnis TaxID=1754191 RepID=A0A1Y1V1L3_9FUNG|nr:hypothetical protein BCR36DRAFT_359645 [Piromyces finnis]|eukprot:ORX44525.1 hypothetical protein BCR36DRAFT_359645 [Piromyces finnis]
METQNESNIHFEIRDGIWMIEREKGTGNFQLTSPRPWDEYDVSKSFPILYWGQAKSFIQLAKNLWDNGFKFLVDSDIGPKRKLKFEFRSPYIPKGTLVTCFIAYNGTGILYRFSDPLNPADYRQILISGADDRYPHGSVKFSIFHSNNNNNGGRGIILNWNNSINKNYNNNNNGNNKSVNEVYGIEEVYTYYWMKSAPQNQTQIKKRKHKKIINEDELELCYPLDFRLNSKYFTKEYPLIIKPLNRFYDLRSLYMVELAEKCLFHQGVEHIEEYRMEALVKKEKLKEIFYHYPKLLQFCLWYYTPKCYQGRGESHSSIKKKKENYFINFLASIAEYIPPNSLKHYKYPKIKLTSHPTTDYQQLNTIQQWINIMHYYPNHHCTQCHSWYLIQSINPKRFLSLTSSPKSLNNLSPKKFSYKANEAIMKSNEEEKNKEQYERIKNIKEKYDNLGPSLQKTMKKKKKKKSTILVTPDDEKTTTSTSNKVNTINSTNQKNHTIQNGGIFSRLFKPSSSFSSSSPTTTSNTNIDLTTANNDKQQMINKKNSIQVDSEEWINVENQIYTSNQNTKGKDTQRITTNNFTISPDTSLVKMYDNSFNYDFNMDNLAQMPNSEQQFQNILQDSDGDVLTAIAKEQNNLDYQNVNDDIGIGTFYTNSKIEEREKIMMEWDQESNIMNFGLNVSNMITPSTIAEMALDDDSSFTDLSKIRDKSYKPIETNFNMTKPEQQQELKSLSDQKNIEHKIHGCLSSSYYHIPPNTIMNECSSESCCFENRELIAQQLVYKLSYYLIAYRWAKRSVQLGFLVGIYFLSQKLWKSDHFWQWTKNECQEKIILMCLNGQLSWINYIRNKKSTSSEKDEKFIEILKNIRKREKSVRLLRLYRKRNRLSEEDLTQLKLKKELGSTTVLKEIKELSSMFILENFFRIFEQYKSMIIDWYHHYVKDQVLKIRTWNDILVQINILLAALKTQLIHLINSLKNKCNPEVLKKSIQTIYLTKWWNEKIIFIKIFIKLAMNKPSIIHS